MPLFQCTESEIKLLKRLRTLEAADFNRVVLGLKPMAILEKSDTRQEIIEHPPTLAPLTPAAGRV